MIEQETLPGVFERHAVLGRAAREAVKGMGLELFGPEDENANVVTVARTPEGIDGAAMPKTMRDKLGITIAGGQGHLKGKIVRIAHCGYYGAFDVLTSIAALELALDELGHDVTFGAGTAARAGSLRARRRARRAAGRLSRPHLTMSENGYRVLVKEKIADAGVDLLREHFDVDVRTDMSEEELPGAIADYDAIVIRSATKLTADVIERADRLKVIGRAGIGVDNVDVPAATKQRHHRRERARVEHRRRRRAHDRDDARAGAQHPAGARVAEERQVGAQQVRRGGGVREDARHPRLRPHRAARRRARAARSAWRCIAFDPFVAAERYRELGVERAESPEALYARADIITIHLPKTAGDDRTT